MHIGILSDTHDRHHVVRNAIEVFNRQGVAWVLHAGDIVSPSTISLFSEFNGRLTAVFGNCDSDRMSLRAAVSRLGGEIHDHTFDGRIDDKAIHMTHIPYAIAPTAGSSKYDLVVYGHTHHQDIHKVRDTLVVNPGAGQAVIVDFEDMSTVTESLT